MTPLKFNSLKICFKTPAGIVKAADGVSLKENEGDIFGMWENPVAESQPQAVRFLISSVPLREGPV